MSRRFLPYAHQSIGEDDIAAVEQVLRSDWLTSGPAVQRFEAAFATAVGARYAVACANGTAALHLAMLAAGVVPGDRVVVPAMTFAASANAVRLVGAEVAFADVDPHSGLLTPETLARALAQLPDAVAVMAVHLNGQCCDLAALREVAGQRLMLVDAAHAVGARYRWQDGDEPVGGGRWAELTAFSLHPVKTLTAGEGGMVATDDPERAHRLRRLAGHGIERDAARFTEAAQAFDSDGEANPWYYEQQALGLNYRLSDIHAALGLGQLGKLERFVARRQALVRRYDEALATALPTVRPVTRVPTGTPAWHLYPVLIDFDALGIPRATVMRRLRAGGIGTQVHYLPVYRHPYYRARYGSIVLSGAEAYYRRVLSLPLFPAMADDDVEWVVEALGEALAS